MKWISVKDKLPTQRTNLLLIYRKGDREVITQGYLIDTAKYSDLKINKEPNKEEFWRSLGYGLTFYDYANRQIQSLTAKKSKNEVTHWAELPEPPKSK